MPPGNTRHSYGSVAKTFHWLTALLIVTIIPVGLIASGMAQDLRDPGIASTPEDLTRTFFLFSLHKTLGVAVFLVALARILWAFSQPRPGLLNGDKRIEAFAAETVHWLLYGSLLLVPLTGWIDHAASTGYAPIRWPFGQSLPFVPKDQAIAELFAGLHLVFGRVLLVALVLHIAGALKHHVIDRDATLRRMLPGASDAPRAPAQHRSLLPPVAALALWAAAIAIGGAFGVVTPPSNAAPADAAPSHAALSGEPARQDSAAQATTGWLVSDGSLGLAITQMGSRVDGSFATWTASITFDETITNGPLGKVEVEVDIASLALGSVAAQALGPDFLDAGFFATSTFSGEISRTDTGYVATGPLVIRDTSLTVDLPFDLTLDGDRAQMSGRLSLNRLDFGVGAGMADESALGFDVEIDVTLTATRGP